jgi:hypothetical protein
MAFLRFVALLALALWVGGLVALGGLGAPSIFAVLEAAVPTTGRELAGQVFGAIFERAQYAAWGLGFLVLLSLAVRAALGPRPRHWKLRLWTTMGMIAASLASALVIAPRIDAIRRETSGTIASLADTDARKITFGRLHGLAGGLMLATVLAGTGLMLAEMRDAH